MSQAWAASNVSLAANSRSANLLASTQMEYLQYNSLLKLAVNGSATGLTVTLIVGNETVLNEVPVQATNRSIQAEDFFHDTGARKGDRLELYIRNTTAAALTYWFHIKANPVGF